MKFRSLFVSALAAGTLVLASQAQAVITINIVTPTNGQIVDPGESVPVTVQVSGAVAGLSQVTISGQNDPFGNTVVSYPAFPPTNSDTINTTYDIPISATPGQFLTLSVNAQGYADDPANASIQVQVASGPVAPANDNLASAQTISGYTGTVSGTNVAATKEASEANHAANVGGSSVWYSWTAPASTDVTIDTIGSDFDTLLAVYTGSAFPLTLVAENDDIVANTNVRSTVTFTATQGTNYKIAVDGFAADEGAVTLNWLQTLPTSVENSWAMYE